MRLQQTGDTRRTGRLDEDAFFAGDPSVGLEDQLVGDRLDRALGLVARG